MDYIGNYQYGDRVPIMVQFNNRRGAPLDPVSAPLCHIIKCSDGTTVTSFYLPICDPSKTDGLFLGELYLTDVFATEDHVAVIDGNVDGKSVVVMQRFKILPGGDAAGEVQEMGFWKRPEANELIMQLGGGSLVSGRNPSIPTQEF